MFTDARSGSILLVAHCVLNQNSISDGTATYPGSVVDIVEWLLASQIGIVQLPCPELMCLGLDRGDVDGANSPVLEENTRIRAAMSREAASAKLEALVESVVYQVCEYRKNGFDIRGIVGINRSPSCGVETTTRDNREVAGRGVFMEALCRELERRGIHLRTVGVKDAAPQESLQAVRSLTAPES